MTKARDLANASTALSAVSATELAFVDGVTSAIQTQLDAKAASSTSVSNAGGSTITVASGTTVPLTIQNNGTGNSLVVNDVASDTTPVVVDAAGNVGIGIASPGYKFDIRETTDTNVLNITSSATANNTSLRIGTDGDDVYLNASGGSTGKLAIRTYGTERMRIDGAGNVGIGKTPSYKLDVNGTVNATALYVGGAALSTTPTFVGCSAGGTTTLTNGATTYSLAMTSENFDTDGFHDNTTNNTRLTIPTGKGGKYQVNIRVGLDNASGSPGGHNIHVRVNGTTGTFSYTNTSTILGNATSGTNTISVGNGILSLAAGDYIEVLARTDNGNGNISATVVAAIAYLGA